MIKPIEVVKTFDGVTIYVGEVSQSGNYNVMELTDIEAVILLQQLQIKLGVK